MLERAHHLLELICIEMCPCGNAIGNLLIIDHICSHELRNILCLCIPSLDPGFLLIYYYFIIGGFELVDHKIGARPLVMVVEEMSSELLVLLFLSWCYWLVV